MVKGITHLRHVALLSPNFEEQTKFYDEVWGLDIVAQKEDAVYFRGAGPEHHILQLIKSDRRGIHHVAFGMVDKVAVDQAAKELERLGVRLVSEPGYLDEEGGGYGFHFLDPDGRCIELSTWVDIHTSYWEKKNCEPIKLNHIVFNTPDLHKTAQFYTEILGFKVSDWSEDQMVFIRCRKEHHSIALNRAPHPSLNHVAYEVEGVDEVMRGMANLKKKGHEHLWGPGRHGPGNNIFCYFKDMDDYVLEYTCYLSTIEDEENYQALVWKRVPHLMDRWGIAGPPTPETRAYMLGEPDEGWATLAK